MLFKSETLLIVLIVGNLSWGVYELRKSYVNTTYLYAVIHDKVYPSWNAVCRGGVAYLKQRDYTLMVGVDGKPVQCHNIELTQQQFNNLGE